MKILLHSTFAITLILISYRLFALHHDSKGFTKSEAVSISKTGSFELDRPPKKALPLFSGPGEKIWIDHWDPTFLNGDGFERGNVFITNNHGHKTHWLVVEYDTKALRAVYARVTPDVDMGTVEVQLVSNGKGGSIVNVTYQLTSLSQKGSHILQKNYSQDKYDHMMQDWRSMIVKSKDKIDAHFFKKIRYNILIKKHSKIDF